MSLVVDCPSDSPGCAMRVAGMTVLERVLRDHAGLGETRAVVRGDAGRLPALPALPIAVEIVPPGAAIPDGTRIVRGDVVLGLEITNERSRRDAEWALMQTCRRPYDGPADRYLIRPISLRLSRLLTATPVTPNQVTVFGAFVGLAAVVLAALGHLRWAGGVMIAQVILDSVDGELARVRHMGSQLGQWIDNVSDDLIDSGFVAGVGIAVGGAWMAVGVAAAALRLACAATTYVSVYRAGHGGDVMAFRWWFDGQGADTNEIYGRITPAVAARSLGRRDLYVCLWGALCLAGWPLVVIGYGAGIAAGYAVLHVVNALLGR